MTVEYFQYISMGLHTFKCRIQVNEVKLILFYSGIYKCVAACTEHVQWRRNQTHTSTPTVKLVAGK